MKGLKEYEIEDDQLDPIYGGVVEQGIEDTIERIIRMKKDEGLNKEAFLAELSSDSLYVRLFPDIREEVERRWDIV